MACQNSSLQIFTNILLLILLFFVINHVQIWANNDIQQFDSIAREADRINFSHESRARTLINQLYRIAEQHPDNQCLQWECLYHETALNYAQSVYDSSLSRRVEISLQHTELEEGSFYHTLLLYSWSLNQLTKGSYNEAFTTALHAMESFKRMNDSIFIAKACIVLGRVCSYIESYRMAEEYYSQALEFTHPPQLEYYLIRSNIYNTWIHNKIDIAIDSMLTLIPVFEKMQDTGLIVVTNLNVGAIYYMKGDHESAYPYYKIATSLEPFIDNNRISISLYHNLGIYYTNTNNLQKAYQSFQRVKNLADRSKNPQLIASALLALSYIHEERNDIDSAYFYIKEYHALRSKILNNASPIEAYQDFVTVYLEASQKELTIKGQEILLNKRRLMVTLILSVGIILLIVSFVIILYQQKRHIRQQNLLKEAENKELEERLQSEQKIQHLQEERIEAQIRELTSYSLALSNKNQILQQISASMYRLPDDPNAVSEINQIIKNNLNTDKAWSDFLLHFDKVHPSFFNRLKQFCDTLSENDLRLCAYFRINMTAKQIAQILNVSPESIKMHRYRIKKKLKLAEEENIDDFIRNV